MESNRIVYMEFGSHVYGTNVPSSDRDYKYIFIPAARDLLLQKAAKHIQNNTKKDSSRRNSANDIDEEGFSIQTFMELVRQGQTLAIDMLFTPKTHWKLSLPAWDEIIERRSELLHSGTNAFIGYTKAQAAKYGAKGDRIAALRSVVELMESWPDKALLGANESELRKFASAISSKEVEIINVKSPAGTDGEFVDMPHLSVANRKVGFNSTNQYAKEVYKLALEKYGSRALQAEQSLGIDWKACMHAVRIAREAEELLLTGHVTFPRPERELLLQVRKGELPYFEVEQLIEEGLRKITEAQQKTRLPARPHHELMERFVYENHFKAVSTLFSK